MNIVEFFKENREKLIALFGFAMVFVFGFFSGYYYLLEKVDDRQVSIEQPSTDCAGLFNAGVSGAAIDPSEKADRPDNTVASGESKVKAYVASKNSKIFHVPSCSFASRIKEENKVQFSSKEEALDAGYEPHALCVK